MLDRNYPGVQAMTAVLGFGSHWQSAEKSALIASPVTGSH